MELGKFPSLPSSSWKPGRGEVRVWFYWQGGLKDWEERRPSSKVARQEKFREGLALLLYSGIRLIG